MRFIRFSSPGGKARVGLLDRGGVSPVLDRDGRAVSCLSHLSPEWGPGDRKRLDLEVALPANSVTWLAPVEPRSVIGTGTNYHDHLVEMAAAAPPAPTANFMKLPASWTGPDTDVILPPGAFVDYEGEIAVVIGRRAHRVAVADVDGHLLGVCLANDVSARDIPTTQLTLGKSMPGFCPLGPALVTLDEVDLDALSFTVQVNGEVRQTASSGSMVHSIRELVASFSHSLALEAGDVILTGSPAGVGVARRPPVALVGGDVVEVHSPQLGVLRNRFLAFSPTGAYYPLP